MNVFLYLLYIDKHTEQQLFRTCVKWYTKTMSTLGPFLVESRVLGLGFFVIDSKNMSVIPQKLFLLKHGEPNGSRDVLKGYIHFDSVYQLSV